MPASDDYIEDWKEDFVGADTNSPADTDTINGEFADQPRLIKSVFREEQEGNNIQFLRQDFTTPSSQTDDEVRFADIDLTSPTDGRSLPVSDGNLIRWQTSQGGTWKYGWVRRILFDYFTLETVMYIHPQPIAEGKLTDIAASGLSVTTTGSPYDENFNENGSASFFTYNTSTGDKTAEYPAGKICLFVRDGNADGALERGILAKRITGATYNASFDRTTVFFDQDSAWPNPDDSESDELYLWKPGVVDSGITRIELCQYTPLRAFDGLRAGMEFGTFAVEDPDGLGHISVAFDSNDHSGKPRMNDGSYAVHITPTTMPSATPTYGHLFCVKSKGVAGFTVITGDTVPAGGICDYVVYPLNGVTP